MIDVRLLVIVPALDEENHLPVLLASIAGQTRRPDYLVVVDDGSSDRTPEVAAAFCRLHSSWALTLRRPQRPAEDDRLARAAELLAFQWALGRVPRNWDVVAKLDADLRLNPRTFETLLAALQRDASIGIAGAFLSITGDDGRTVREHGPVHHVRGATKFYRRRCYEQIAPVPAILGWDTIDEAAARMHGWQTQSFEIPGGDPVHLRRSGSHDGVLRGFRRYGACAWGMGAHPLHVLLGGVSRMRERPRPFAGLAFLAGWMQAAAQRAPRAAPDVRAHVRREQIRRLAARSPAHR